MKIQISKNEKSFIESCVLVTEGFLPSLNISVQGEQSDRTEGALAQLRTDDCQWTKVGAIF